MSCITKELRKWARGLNTYNRNELQVLAIADRIDAEYDKALNSVDDAYDSGYNVGYDKGSASADDWLGQHEDEMAEHGWVRKNKEHVISHAAVEVTLGRGTCKEVYLLMATDVGDGREEVLGVYATEEAAIAAINENQFGYALHHVRKWEMG